MQVGDNIRGGIFGAIGYMVDGERGSYVGAAVDGLAMAAGSTAAARQQMRDVGASAQPSRPVAAEVRPLRPPARATTAPRTPPTTPPPAAPAAAPAVPPEVPPVAPPPAAPPT